MTHPQTHTAEAGDETTLREALELIISAAENPTVNPLETGFRHNPLTQKEIVERLSLACEEVVRYARAALAASPAPRAPAAVPEEMLNLVAEAINEARYLDEDGVARGLPYRPLSESGPSDRAYASKLAKAALRTLAAAPAAPPAEGENDGPANCFLCGETIYEDEEFAGTRHDELHHTQCAELVAWKPASAAPPADGGTTKAMWDDETRIAVNGDAETRIARIEREQPFEVSKHLTTVVSHVLGIYDQTTDPAIRELAVALKACAVEAVEAAISSRPPAGAAGDPVGEARFVPGYLNDMALRGERSSIVEPRSTLPPVPAGHTMEVRTALASARPASLAPAASVLKLKPCPFCGGDAVMHPNDIVSGGASMATPGIAQYAHCDGCGAEGLQSFDSEQEAADGWNARAALAPAAQVNPGREEIADPNPGIDASEGQPVTVDYINYRGERGTRRILPGRIVYGATEYHPRHQWLLEAMDLDKSAMRVFALEDMRFLDEPILAARPVAEGDAWRPTGAGRCGLNGPGEREWFCTATGVRQHHPAGFNPNIGRYEGMTITNGAARPAPSPAKGGN